MTKQKINKFPTTRYLGSKLKLLDQIDNLTKHYQFDNVLDVFGGTGSVSYFYKQRGKSVTYNDLLKFNFYIGKALIENNSKVLEEKEIDFLLKKHSTINYSTFIQDNFTDIYYTDEENSWLDRTIKNISLIEDEYKRAIAYFSIFQSALIKRPYNLFHRKNLYIRTSNVKRNFGNKVTWDRSFEEYFKKFCNQANNAIFCNNKLNYSLNKDALKINEKYDLVYMDPPYISNKNQKSNYLDLYHFLEGLADYDNWKNNIDNYSLHKKMKNSESIWSDKNKNLEGFRSLFKNFQDSILVLSYRSDGIPEIQKIKEEMSKYKKNVIIHEIDYKYALSKNKTKEVFLVGF